MTEGRFQSIRMANWLNKFSDSDRSKGASNQNRSESNTSDWSESVGILKFDRFVMSIRSKRISKVSKPSKSGDMKSEKSSRNPRGFVHENHSISIGTKTSLDSQVSSKSSYDTLWGNNECAEWRAYVEVESVWKWFGVNDDVSRPLELLKFMFTSLSLINVLMNFGRKRIR